MEQSTPNPNNKQADILKDEIVEQILEIRDTGETNMFLVNNVMRLAMDRDLFALVNFLSERKNHKAYCEFILRGKRPQDN